MATKASSHHTRSVPEAATTEIATHPVARKKAEVRTFKARQTSDGHSRNTANLKFHDYYLTPVTRRVEIIREGLPAKMLVEAGVEMGESKEALFSMLHFPRATINKKIAADERLSSDSSERVFGLFHLIGQVEAMVAGAEVPENFTAARWLARWLQEPCPALGGVLPRDYMDTMEGQRLVSGLLEQMHSGAYA